MEDAPSPKHRSKYAIKLPKGSAIEGTVIRQSSARQFVIDESSPAASPSAGSRSLSRPKSKQDNKADRSPTKLIPSPSPRPLISPRVPTQSKAHTRPSRDRKLDTEQQAQNETRAQTQLQIQLQAQTRAQASGIPRYQFNSNKSPTPQAQSRTLPTPVRRYTTSAIPTPSSSPRPSPSSSACPSPSPSPNPSPAPTRYRGTRRSSLPTLPMDKGTAGSKDIPKPTIEIMDIPPSNDDPTFTNKGALTPTSQAYLIALSAVEQEMDQALTLWVQSRAEYDLKLQGDGQDVDVSAGDEETEIRMQLIIDSYMQENYTEDLKETFALFKGLRGK